MSVCIKRQLWPRLLLLSLVLLSSVFADAATEKGAQRVQKGAARESSSNGAAAAATPSTASQDLGVCEKKLKYAEQRADNAESDLLAFRQKHEESIAACTRKLQQQQQEQQQQNWKEQAEALRSRFNEETKAKAAIEAKLRQLQQQQRQDSETVEELRRELEEARAKMQHQQQKQQQQQQQLNERGTLAKAMEVFADFKQMYAAAISVAVSFVPPSLREVAQEQMALGSAAAIERLNKVYVHFEPHIEKYKELYFDYVHPHAIATATFASTTAKDAAVRAAEVVNQPLDRGLAVVYEQHPHLQSLIPSDLQGRIILLMLLLGAAYLAGVLALACLRTFCRYTCRRRRRRSGQSNKKMFTVDAKRADKGLTSIPAADKGVDRGASAAGRESSQTPQPVPPRPLELEKRRKHGNARGPALS